MDDNLHYVVVGGVNGAGKSTIYEFDTIRIEGLKTDRINADEILQRMVETGRIQQTLLRVCDK